MFYVFVKSSFHDCVCSWLLEDINYA